MRASPAMFRSPASLDDRDEQAPLGVHGDAEVLGVVVGDLPAVRCRCDAFTIGCTFSASTAAFAKNGRNDSLTPSRASKSALARVAQPGDRGDVDLDDRGQLRRDLQRLDHALGDDLAQPGHRLGAAGAAGPRRRPRGTPTGSRSSRTLVCSPPDDGALGARGGEVRGADRVAGDGRSERSARRVDLPPAGADRPAGARSAARPAARAAPPTRAGAAPPARRPPRRTPRPPRDAPHRDPANRMPCCGAPRRPGTWVRASATAAAARGEQRGRSSRALRPTHSGRSLNRASTEAPSMTAAVRMTSSSLRRTSTTTAPRNQLLPRPLTSTQPGSSYARGDPAHGPRVVLVLREPADARQQDHDDHQHERRDVVHSGLLRPWRDRCLVVPCAAARRARPISSGLRARSSTWPQSSQSDAATSVVISFVPRR